MKVFPLVLAAASVGAISTPEQAAFEFESEMTDGALDWDHAPSPDATGNLIFNSVSSVLQRWPNTIKRPGHSLIPATMPAGTVIYHGRGSAEVPSQPEWLAFDFEHAYIFARGQQGHVLTFATTRALKLLYFDGASAAKIDDGALDSQDLIMYREVKGGEGHERGGAGEHERIQKLCEWGKPLGVDGFVRMEFHFEVMYCDFSDGVELISALHLLPSGGHGGGPGGPGGPSGPGGPWGPGGPDRKMHGAVNDADEEPPRHLPFINAEEVEEPPHHRPHSQAEDVRHHHSLTRLENAEHGSHRHHHHDCEHELQGEHPFSHHRHHGSNLLEFITHKLGLSRFFSHPRPDRGDHIHAHSEHPHPHPHHQGYKLSFEAEKFVDEHAHHHDHAKGKKHAKQSEGPHNHDHGRVEVETPEPGHGLKFKADRLDGSHFSSQVKNDEHVRHHEHDDKPKDENYVGKVGRPLKNNQPFRRPSGFPHPPLPPHDGSADPPPVGDVYRSHGPHQGESDSPGGAHTEVHASDEPPQRRPGGPGGPGRGEPATPPEGWKGSLPSAGFTEARVAGKWHDAAPGETRVRPDFTGFITLYDPALSSLVEARRGLPHIRHRIKGISATDADAKMAELKEVLGRTPGTGSGIDWSSVTRVVIERYSQRLELLAHTLTSVQYDAAEKAKSVRAQLLTMLVLYFTVDDVPSQDGSRAWLAPVVQRCATTQLRAIPTTLLTPQERLIYTAVGETLHEICRRLAIMFDATYDVETATLEVAEEKVALVERETSELMAWLDWSVWVKCQPACSIEEMCVVPTWPFGRDEDPYDMTPKCVRMSST